MAKLKWDDATSLAEIPVNGGGSELHVRLIPDTDGSKSIVLSKFIRTERYTGYAKGGTEVLATAEAESLIVALKDGIQKVAAA